MNKIPSTLDAEMCVQLEIKKNERDFSGVTYFHELFKNPFKKINCHLHKWNSVLNFRAHKKQRKFKRRE